jgi:membrane protease YdiL (CAAX protease family)
MTTSALSDPAANAAANAAASADGAPRRPRLLALLGLAIALILPMIPLGRLIAPGSSIAALLTREAVWWAYAGIVLACLVWAERRTLASIGFRGLSWKTLAFGLLTGVAATLVMALHFAVIVPVFHLDAGHSGAVRDQILQTPYWYRVLMVLRAAVVEEILFRAYLMEKVRQLTGSWILALIVSVAGFTYAHLSGWGLVHLIPVFGAGVVFAMMYIWRRDTPANMVGHFLTDGAGFLLS